MQTSDSIKELAKALSVAQGQMTHAAKGEEAQISNAPNARKRKYSSMADVIDAFREPFSKNGLSVTQLAENDEDKVKIITLLMHESGEFLSTELDYPMSRIGTGQSGIQALGSCISYLKRYALKSILNIADDDEEDDGARMMDAEKNNKASKQSKPQDPPKPPEPTPEEKSKNQAVENAKNICVRFFALIKENGYTWPQVGQITGSVKIEDAINSPIEANAIAKQGNYNHLNIAIKQLQADINKHKAAAVEIKQESVTEDLLTLQSRYVDIQVDLMDLGVDAKDFAKVSMIENVETASAQDLSIAVERLGKLHDEISHAPMPTADNIRAICAKHINLTNQTQHV